MNQSYFFFILGRLKKTAIRLRNIILMVKKRLKLAQTCDQPAAGSQAERGARLHPVVFRLALSASIKKDCQLPINFMIAI